MRQLLFILILSVLIGSCDCVQKVEGTVVDIATGKPLSGAKINNKEKVWSNAISDSAGHFALSEISGGLSCPPMNIIVKMKGYKTVETSIDAGGYKLIKLERRDTKSGLLKLIDEEDK